MIPACSACDKFAMRLMPEAAGTICRPCGPVTMASSRAHWPSMTLPRWKRVCRPNTTSTLANPKSASTNITSRPDAAMETARLADTVVLPTPPSPPVSAMTLTGREELSSANASARSGESLESRMGSSSAEDTGQRRLIAGARHAFLELSRRADQPHPFLMCRVQVLRHSLSIAHISDFQLMAQHRGNRSAQARSLIDLGQDAGGRVDACEGPHDFLQGMALALRRQRQQHPRPRGAEFERGELLGEPNIARSHARRIDQNQFFGCEPLQHAAQFLPAVGGVPGG